ncbi:hypothetical protein L0Z11_11490 [Burkholderia multivorans]|uniref:hypothetical protein n=1 Tax=Burkholderia multivorans TaxID=87883 RepID=UPI002019617B|nr:hypothetical protein [Burkholderia multivorans]UQN68309.1 hypothetical protein L0Z45_11510 [Burkholderia multivorans]UQN74038.1 hypothetical protein L0Z11_11490 [Burkholderia multivorans]
MTQTILSREEVLEIAARIGSQSLNVTRIHELNGPTRTIFDDAGLEEFAAAILERVCGEPAAWMVLAANTGLPCEVTLHKSETEALRQDCVIPLYAINRSKS